MKLKRFLSGILATTAAFGCMATMTACETSHPEVTITLEFQGETYELDYTLYRKIAPATVAHFLALAEKGYYDGLCVHDYDGTRMYTGGYEYDASADDKLKEQKYFELVKTYENFPTTVYKDENKTQPTYTLYGEFYDNSKFNVENGEKKESFGSLTMYYTDKSDCTEKVMLDHPEAGEWKGRDYADNSATSLFFISLTQEEKTNTNYCTFAELDEDSVDALTELQTELEEYASDAANVLSVTKTVDSNDPYVSDHNKKATYELLAEPLIIKKVEVKKF
ncbi:MAG: peptidylprolyl isomerase [Clostridia bacterium]|nr:peptidylprolyl isomerase [Clostridia bacterium]